MATSYIVGETVRLTVTFALGETAADPSAVSLRLRDPVDKTVTEYEFGVDPEIVDMAGDGAYRCDFTPSSEGVWHYDWEGHYEAEDPPAVVISQGTFTAEHRMTHS